MQIQTFSILFSLHVSKLTFAPLQSEMQDLFKFTSLLFRGCVGGGRGDSSQPAEIPKSVATENIPIFPLEFGGVPTRFLNI